MNSPDPASVKALLEQLRVSQAWHKTQASSSNSDVPVEPSPDQSSVTAEDASSSSSPVTATVAELLAQLKNPTGSYLSAVPLPPFIRTHDLPPVVSPPSQAPQPPPVIRLPTPNVELKSCTFQNALSVIARLGHNPTFVAALREMRNDQNRIEDILWAEREAIKKKYTDKLTAAKIKATMIGVGITPHEAKMLQEAYQRDLRKFDEGRVLKAWENLISKQQAGLEALGVPTMSTDTHAQPREKQAQIMQVLVGLLESTDTS